MKKLFIKYAVLLLALIGINEAKPFSEHDFILGASLSAKDNDDYYVSDKEVSWFSANYYCYSQGWKLVSPLDFDAITLLKGFRELYNLTGKKYWTAGNRLVGNKWIWGLDGQKFYYLNWANGEPADGDDENCLVLEKTVENLWSSDDCAAKYRFMCEKKGSKVVRP